jgi:anaerobic selenocysteine-containing dehydrogenase
LNSSTQRRQFLKLGSAALAAIPVVAFTNHAFAATNAAMRTALKYQATPLAEKNCGNCLQFVPGASAKAPGGCKIMPGDTEIAVTGYCTAWAKKA